MQIYWNKRKRLHKKRVQLNLPFNPPTFICNTFIEGHPNFLQNIFLYCRNVLLPFLSPQFFLYSILGHQLLLKRKHRVVPIHGHVYRKLELEVSRTMDIESKVYLLSMLGRKNKVQDCDYLFGSSTKFQRGMTGFVKAVYVLKWVFVDVYFAGFYLPLNPSATTVYARSAFYPSLRFTLSL